MKEIDLKEHSSKLSKYRVTETEEDYDPPIETFLLRGDAVKFHGFLKTYDEEEKTWHQGTVCERVKPNPFMLISEENIVSYIVQYTPHKFLYKRDYSYENMFGFFQIKDLRLSKYVRFKCWLRKKRGYEDQPVIL